MKTAKGHSYANLLDITLTDTTLTFKKAFNQLSFELSADEIAKMIPVISQRIQLSTKPAGTLQRQLERIELHREQLLDAFEELFRCYRQMTEPQTRQSPIDKARSEMLSTIRDMKMLRSMCRLSLGEAANSYVLPDDKTALIAATVTAMKEPAVPSKVEEA